MLGWTFGIPTETNLCYARNTHQGYRKSLPDLVREGNNFLCIQKCRNYTFPSLFRSTHSHSSRIYGGNCQWSFRFGWLPMQDEMGDVRIRSECPPLFHRSRGGLPKIPLGSFAAGASSKPLNPGRQGSRLFVAHLLFAVRLPVRPPQSIS